MRRQQHTEKPLLGWLLNPANVSAFAGHFLSLRKYNDGEERPFERHLQGKKLSDYNSAA